VGECSGIDRLYQETELGVGKKRQNRVWTKNN
jgi:hypothetical protein